MTKEKPIHGLTIALREPLAAAKIGGNWVKILALLVKKQRGASIRELDPKEIPTAEIVAQAIEVVRQQAGLLIADLEAIKNELTKNPPARRPRGKPFGWRKNPS